ncbi:MAG TPA: hypothetical protein PLD86_14190 [Vicinamibacteria bacterium]|nr:hypothetical protein [Vicinamibacteria bacterium]
MKKFTIVALVLALAVPALADKPQKQDKGKGKDKSGTSVQVTVTFGDHDRDEARAYFSQKYGRGNCPPGLAKKNNGCLPPGQAKKRYQVGQPLPRGVVYVEAPPDLVVRLSPAPSGYKYVVVDGDLVKLALGTLLVVDAIDGLIH